MINAFCASGWVTIPAALCQGGLRRRGGRGDFLLRTCLAYILLGCWWALSLPAKGEEMPVKPVVRMISPGIYQVGQVRLDQKARSVSFAGKLNMKRGLLEYLVVHANGSVHESLLVTEVDANEIHVAMLLLGVKGGAVVGEAPPPQIDPQYLLHAPKLTGDKVFISVKWKDKDTDKTAVIEDWVVNETAQKRIEHGPWIYNGSMIHAGRFLAQTEGNLVALVTTPTALINNPRKGNDNDQMWNVNGDTTPGVGTPVEIVFTLAPASAAAPTKQP